MPSRAGDHNGAYRNTKILYKMEKAKHVRPFLMLIFLLSFSISCSTIKGDIKRNNNKTDKWVNYLVRKNGNAFYVTSTYSTYSTVWSYVNNQIMIYRITSGKILKEETYARNSNFINKLPSHKQLDKELFEKCGYELDGDFFGFKIKKDNSLIEENFSINLECIKNGKYNLFFFSEISRDITAFNLWEIIKYK